MNGTILCVGRLKEKWQQQGCAEYLKRLSRYGKYEIVAVDGLMTCGLIAVMLRTFELRRRVLGVQGIPRIHESLRRREVVALIALGVVLAGTTAAVLLGV